MRKKESRTKKIPTMSLGKTTMCSSLSRTSFRRGRTPRRPPLRLLQMLRFPMRLVGVTAPMTAERLSGRSCHAAWQLRANHGPAAVIDSSERAGTVKSDTFMFLWVVILYGSLCVPRCLSMCISSFVFHCWHLAVEFRWIITHLCVNFSKHTTWLHLVIMFDLLRCSI